MKFALIGKKNVHKTRPNELEKLIAVTVDAERVRKRQGGLAARTTRRCSGSTKRFLGAGRVPKVALEIEDARGLDDLLVDILGP